jgi:hypothetical protein
MPRAPDPARRAEAGINLRSVSGTRVGVSLVWMRPPPATTSPTSPRPASAPRHRRGARSIRWRALPVEPARCPRGCCAATAVPDPPGVQPLPQRDRDAALPQAPREPRSRADHSMIPLGSCTMKLNAASRDDPGHLAGVRRPAPVRTARAGRWATPAMLEQLATGWPRSPASRRVACSRTPARRANTPACWRSATTTSRGVRAIAMSA